MILKNKNKNEEGFVALITAIILSLILISITVTLNQSGYLTRSSLLDTEYKERSTALAEACANVALLKLANDPTYQVASPQQISVGTDSCWIHSVVTGTQDTIKASATFQDTAAGKGVSTNLIIVVNASDLSVQSWNEVPAF